MGADAAAVAADRGRAPRVVDRGDRPARRRWRLDDRLAEGPQGQRGQADHQQRERDLPALDGRDVLSRDGAVRTGDLAQCGRMTRPRADDVPADDGDELEAPGDRSRQPAGLRLEVADPEQVPAEPERVADSRITIRWLSNRTNVR